MKTVFFFICSLVSIPIFAQSLSCRPHGESLYLSLRILKPEYSFDVPWFSAQLDNKYHQRRNFVLNASLRNSSVYFSSKDDQDEFHLMIEDYKGPSIYHSVELVLNQGRLNEEKVTLMCEQGGEMKFEDSCQTENLQESLFQAAIDRDVHRMESALQCGAKANSKNMFGCTPLLLAADPFCGQDLPTPIAYNPVKPALPVVDLLTSNGAFLEAKDPKSWELPLHKFTRLGDLETVSFLLDLEADADSQDLKGYTALMRAVGLNDKYLVQRIVEAGADLSISNSSGETALKIAQKLGFEKLEPLLREPSISIEIIGHEHGTCSPINIKLPMGQPSRIVLKASPDQMFLMTAPGLGLSLMADAGSRVSQNVIPNRAGSFEFTCGVHGASKQITGQIIVE